MWVLVTARGIKCSRELLKLCWFAWEKATVSGLDVYLCLEWYRSPLHLTHDNPNHLLLDRIIFKHMWLQTSLSFEEGFAASSWLAPAVLLTPALAHSSSLMLLPWTVWRPRQMFLLELEASWFYISLPRNLYSCILCPEVITKKKNMEEAKVLYSY